MTLSAFAQPRGQEPLARNVFFVELLGNAVGLSLNYEYMYFESISMRFGFGGHSCFCDIEYAPDYVYDEGEIPTGTTMGIFMANFITPKLPHHLEVGAGLMYLIGQDGRGFLEGDKDDYVLPIASFGYRYQPRSGGFFFRIGATPIFQKQGMRMSGGISFGSAF